MYLLTGCSLHTDSKTRNSNEVVRPVAAEDDMGCIVHDIGQSEHR